MAAAAPMWLTLLAVLVAVAAGDPAGQLPLHLQRLRTVAGLPAPTSLSGAIALHAEAKRRAARIQQHFGHAPPPPPPLPSTRQPLSGAESAILRPSDFGADATGATDSSPAFGKAMAALLAARGPRQTMASVAPGGGVTLTVYGVSILIDAESLKKHAGCSGVQMILPLGARPATSPTSAAPRWTSRAART